MIISKLFLFLFTFFLLLSFPNNGKKNKKHKSPLNTPLPSWQTALSLVKGDAQDKASYYREKAKVKNTEKSTKNWIMKFEEFRSQSGYLISLIELDNIPFNLLII